MRTHIQGTMDNSVSSTKFFQKIETLNTYSDCTLNLTCNFNSCVYKDMLIFLLGAIFTSRLLQMIATVMTVNPNVPTGWVGKVRKKLSPEGGRKGGWRKKSTRSAPARRGAQTRDLPRATRGSPAARHGGCSDKLAFPCL